MHRPRLFELVEIQSILLDVLKQGIVHLGSDSPTLVTVTPNIICKLVNRSLPHHLLVFNSQPPGVLMLWWRAHRVPNSIVGAVPKGVLRGFPEIAGIRGVVWLLEFWQIWVKRPHAVVHEAEWRVVDDVSRDDERIGIFDLVGDKLGDSTIFDPELDLLAVAHKESASRTISSSILT